MLKKNLVPMSIFVFTLKELLGPSNPINCLQKFSPKPIPPAF